MKVKIATNVDISNTGTEVLTLKATTSLFARLLVRVDLEEVIGMCEISYISKVIMVPDLIYSSQYGQEHNDNDGTTRREGGYDE